MMGRKIFITSCPRLVVKVFYQNIWNLRKKIRESGHYTGCRHTLYEAYWQTYGSWIGIGAEFEDIPIFPHGGAWGVFISNSAHIGKNCVIFHQVTIGSNMLIDSKNQGAPTLEDNVFVGCGAKIIGKVHVGKNARIGANAVVVKDVPANSVTVIRGVESIAKAEELNNTYVENKL